MHPSARIQTSMELCELLEAGLIDRSRPPADRLCSLFFKQRRFIGSRDRADIHDRIYRIMRHRARLLWWLKKAGISVSAPRVGEHWTESPEIGPLGRGRLMVLAELMVSEKMRTADVAAMCDAHPHAPVKLSREENALLDRLEGKELDNPEQDEATRLELPEWLMPDLRARFGEDLAAEAEAMRGGANVHLRVNPLKAKREDAIRALLRVGISATATTSSPYGLEVRGRPPLMGLDVYKDGVIEIQDEGSQLIALLTDARPGMRVVDFCAGAGGKTLLLAATMENRGKLIACDTSEGRLEAGVKRLRRAGVHNVQRHTLVSARDKWVKRHKRGFDRVLVDAPCSGCGTWRRNPDAKWRSRPEELQELKDLQAEILDSAARMVAPGGRVAYATCSLLPGENEEVVAGFLAKNSDFHLLPLPQVWQESLAPLGAGPCPDSGDMMALSPAKHGTDGFFCAILERDAAAEETASLADGGAAIAEIVADDQPDNAGDN